MEEPSRAPVARCWAPQNQGHGGWGEASSSEPLRSKPTEKCGKAPAATRDMFHKEGNHISCPFCKMNSCGNEIRQVIKQFKRRKKKKEKQKTLENLQLGFPKASESRMKSHILPRLSPGSGLWISALPNSRSPEQKIDGLLQHTHLKNPCFASGGGTDWVLLPVVNSKECWSVKN